MLGKSPRQPRIVEPSSMRSSLTTEPVAIGGKRSIRCVDDHVLRLAQRLVRVTAFETFARSEEISIGELELLAGVLHSDVSPPEVCVRALPELKFVAQDPPRFR